MGYEAVIEALESRDLLKGGWGAAKTALCPAHDDNNASLSIKEGDDGKALVFCHAGCATSEVVDALGLTMADLFRGQADGTAVVDTYEYQDEEGQPLYRVVRLSPKGFFQERWEDGEWKPGMRDVRRVLYRLPQLMQAGPTEPVWITEGEKDADALARLGLVATTLLGGAGKIKEEYIEFFRGREVRVVGDDDGPGRDHVGNLVAVLGRNVSGVRGVRAFFPRVGKDVSDHLGAGFGVEDLIEENDDLDEFGPLDWESYEVPDTDWILEPYIPKGGRVLAFGPKGSLKSLWAMWVAAHVAKDGGKVAYFSLEMLLSDTAKRVRSLNPPRENFLLFTRNLKLGSPSQLEKLIAGLKGFDLIVIDSWTAAQQMGDGSNEAVARLDSDWTLPLVTETGAAILFLDNTGHDQITNDGLVKNEHARGASAKGDKVEVELWFRRPVEENNYRTQMKVKKMRLDHPMPLPLTMETPQDRIEFYQVDSAWGMTTTPCWPGLLVDPDMDAVPTSKQEAPAATATTDTTPTDSSATSNEMTAKERRALARLKDTFKAQEIET